MTQYSTQNHYGHDQKQSGRMEQVAEKAQEIGSEAIDRAKEVGGEALDRAEEWLKPVGLSVKERPMTVLAVIGGVAFAAGALWMLRGSQQQSRMDRLAQQVSDYARKARW
jgi:hypothetical protein